VHSIKNEMVCTFDVDETLVLERPKPGCNVEILNPYTDVNEYRLVHEKHVKLLKHMYGRGRFIIVWSGNGAEWAEAVVDALDIRKHVHLVMTKPICFVDDMPAEQWMNNRVYLSPEESK
jgi:hypothetical protein